jgi:prepilin-type N-terminal cleavage/methylation domain-containing protein
LQLLAVAELNAVRSAARRGFTLIEILIVVAIILLLAGLLLPVVKSAQGQGLSADDLARMRQMGMARALYASDHGVEVDWCDPLVGTGYVPINLCQSRSDYSSTGLANEILSALSQTSAFYKGFVTNYPRTYLGSGELLKQQDLARISGQPDAGWLVNLIRAKADPTTFAAPWSWQGRYQRLRLDGSVESKTLRSFTVQDGGKTYIVTSPYLLFCDPDQAWINEITSRS